MTKTNDLKTDMIDHAGKRLVKLSGLSEEEAETITSSPFLYTRVRSRIADPGRLATADLWSNLSAAARSAIPAMGLAAVFSFGLFMYVRGVQPNKPVEPTFSVDAYVGAGDSRIDNMLFAEKRQLTVEEVLATVVGKDEREAAR